MLLPPKMTSNSTLVSPFDPSRFSVTSLYVFGSLRLCSSLYNSRCVFTLPTGACRTAAMQSHIVHGPACAAEDLRVPPAPAAASASVSVRAIACVRMRARAWYECDRAWSVHGSSTCVDTWTRVSERELM